MRGALRPGRGARASSLLSFSLMLLTYIVSCGGTSVVSAMAPRRKAQDAAGAEPQGTRFLRDKNRLQLGGAAKSSAHGRKMLS